MLSLNEAIEEANLRATSPELTVKLEQAQVELEKKWNVKVGCDTAGEGNIDTDLAEPQL